MRFKDFKSNHIHVIMRCYWPGNDGIEGDPDAWNCKIIEYVRDSKQKCYHQIRKSGIYDRYVLSDYKAEQGPPFFGMQMFYDKTYTKNMILLEAQIRGLVPLYSFNESKRDFATGYYLCIPDKLTSREFRKMKLEIE